MILSFLRLADVVPRKRLVGVPCPRVASYLSSAFQAELRSEHSFELFFPSSSFFFAIRSLVLMIVRIMVYSDLIGMSGAAMLTF